MDASENQRRDGLMVWHALFGFLRKARTIGMSQDERSTSTLEIAQTTSSVTVDPTAALERLADFRPCKLGQEEPKNQLSAEIRQQESQGSCHARERHPLARYYYGRIQKRLSQIVEPGARVLEIGCGRGEMLASLNPSVGVGIDADSTQIAEARKRYADLRFFRMRFEDVHELNEKFDYVLFCQSLGNVYDLQTLFRSVQHVCHARTRAIIVHYSRVWQPALRLMEWLGIKQRAPEPNWLPTDEVIHLLRLGGFETIRSFGMTILPVHIPLLSSLCNRLLGNLPFLHLLGLNYVVIARPVRADRRQPSELNSVSIVVPARNEAGHIKQLLQRIPRLANEQEVIFVEGNSTDDTWDVIRETVDTYKGPLTLRALRQDGSGKGDAVRKGFAAAKGDILYILDADISVPPEELTSFHEVITSGAGEFINGSRMVYLMDRNAMRFLNLLGNKFFGWMFTYLLSQHFRDTLCGTKVLSRADYERIAANRTYFGKIDPFGDFDLLLGAAKLNLKIVDVPVHYKARTYGETNISRFRHGWMLLRMCLLAAKKLKFV